jgi:hypothetical protein
MGMEGLNINPQQPKKTLREKLGIDKPLGKTLQAGAMVARLMGNVPDDTLTTPVTPSIETSAQNIEQEHKETPQLKENV